MPGHTTSSGNTSTSAERAANSILYKTKRSDTLLGADTTLTVWPDFFSQRLAVFWQSLYSTPVAPQDSTTSTPCADEEASIIVSRKRFNFITGALGGTQPRSQLPEIQAK